MAEFSKSENDTNNLFVDKMHIIKLTRNAVFGQMDCIEKSEAKNKKRISSEDETHFCMFDYYNKLSYSEFKIDGNIRYTDFIGIDDPFKIVHPSVSSQLITLVEMKDNYEIYSDNLLSDNPFTYKPDKKAYKDRRCDKPFLALISVTLTPPEKEAEDSLFSRTYIPEPDNVRHFLNSCIDHLNSFLKNETVYRIYHSLTSANFYICIRTDDIRIPYKIALQIRSSNFPLCVFHTFTIMGIAYDRENPKLKSDSKNSSCNVLLRLSANHYSCIAQLQRIIYEIDKDAGSNICKIKNKTNPDIGLIGRYDISIKVSFDQYARLYPFLAYNRFEAGKTIESMVPDLKLIKDRAVSEKDVHLLLVAFLADSILKGKFGIVNERLLLDIPPDSFDKNDGDIFHQIQNEMNTPPSGILNKTLCNQIWQQNKVLLDTAQALIARDIDLRYCKRSFKECMKLVIELIRTYCNIRYDYDSLINGYIFYKQISILLDSIGNQLDSIREINKSHGNPFIDSYNKQLCEDMVKWLRIAITSLNSFNKLLQSINQQSMQAPNYEISTRINVEKYIVAYSEFLRSFVESYFRYISSEVEGGEELFPIFTIDYSISSIIAEALFTRPLTYDESNNTLINKNEKEKQTLVAIRSPSYNSFASMFETLPYICHEISHYFTFVRQEIRNNLIIRCVFDRLSEYITSVWLSKSNNEKYYRRIGSVEKIISEEIYNEFIKAYPSKVDKKQSILMLKNDLIGYLLGNFFINQDEYSTINPEIKQKDALIEIFKKLIQIGNLTSYQKLTKKFVELSRSEAFDPTSYIDFLKKLAVEAYSNCYKFYIKAGFNGRFKLLCESLANYGAVNASSLLIDFNITKSVFNKGRNIFEKESRKIYENADTILKNQIKSLKAFEPQIVITDDMINKELKKSPNETAERIKKRLEREMPIKAGKLLEEFLNSDIMLIRENLKSFIHFYSDINHLYLNAKSLLGNKYVSWEVCDEYIENLHIRLRKAFNRLDDSSDIEIEKIHADSREIYSLLSSLCINFKNNDALFKESFKNALLAIDQKAVTRIIDDTIKIYGEILADLSMCAAMDFTPFKYLRFHIQSLIRVRPLITKEGKSADLERISTVLSVLIRYQAENTDISTPSDGEIPGEPEKDKIIIAAEKELFRQITVYVTNVIKKLAKGFILNFNLSGNDKDMLINYIEADFKYELPVKLENTRFLANLELFLKGLKDSLDRNMQNVPTNFVRTCSDKTSIFYIFNNDPEEFFGEYFLNEANKQLPDSDGSYVSTKDKERRLLNENYNMNVDKGHYWEYLKRLESIVMAADGICKNIGKPRFFEIYYDIFISNIKSNNGCKWEGNEPPLKFVRDKISDYYSYTEFNNLSKSEFNKIFRYCLPFVLYYYYRNRHAFGMEITKSISGDTAST